MGICVEIVRARIYILISPVPKKSQYITTVISGLAV